MNKIRFIKLLLSTLLILSVLCSCENSAETPVISEFPRIQAPGFITEPSSHGETEEEKVLTLAFTAYDWEDMESHVIYILAEEYMKHNPEIVIEFKFTPDKTINSYTGYTRGLAKLNGGRGPDIIHFPAAFLYASGALRENFKFVDLWEMMEQDPGFYKDDYFMNVFEACADEQGLYFVALAFNFDYAAVNKKYSDLMEKYTDSDGKINIAQMFRVYQDARLRYQDIRAANSSPELYIKDYNKGKMYTAFNAVPETLFKSAFGIETVDTGSFEFNTEEKKELAAQISLLPRLSDTDKASRSASAAFYPVGEILFASSGGIFSNPANALLKYQESVFDTPLLLAGENGYVPFVYSDSLAINKNCEEKELAWDFIKFCLDSQPNYEGEWRPASDSDLFHRFELDKYSVNRRLFEEAVVSDIERQFDINEKNGLTSVGSKASAVNNAVTKFTEMAEGVNRVHLYQRADVRNSFLTSEILFNDGRMTMDEFAERLERIIRNAAGDDLNE